jgi:hypothetical protein
MVLLFLYLISSHHLFCTLSRVTYLSIEKHISTTFCKRKKKSKIILKLWSWMLSAAPTLQRQIPKFRNKYSRKRNIGVLVPISTFMRLLTIYIFPRLVSLFCWRKYVDRSCDYINRSQTHECWNWGWGRAIPRKGIHKGDFRCSVVYSYTVVVCSVTYSLRRQKLDMRMRSTQRLTAPVPKSQQSWVQYQHTPAQWNLRGDEAWLYIKI